MNATCEAYATCSARLVCRCLQITETEIVESIQTLELRSVGDVRSQTSAGTGCNCCHPEIRRLLERHACSEQPAY